MEIPSLTDFKRLEEKIDQLLELRAKPTKTIIDMADAKILLGNSSDNYIKALISKGKIKSGTKQGGKWLFNKSEILSLVP